MAAEPISFLVDFPDGIIADRERADYHKLGANMRTQTPPSRHWPASIAYLQLFTTVGQLYLTGPSPELNAIAAVDPKAGFASSGLHATQFR